MTEEPYKHLELFELLENLTPLYFLEKYAPRTAAIYHFISGTVYS